MKIVNELDSCLELVDTAKRLQLQPRGFEMLESFQEALENGLPLSEKQKEVLDNIVNNNWYYLDLDKKYNGYVYFAVDKNSISEKGGQTIMTTKIGYSGNPGKRINNLKTAIPGLVLIKAIHDNDIDNHRDLERYFHERFSNSNIDRELFTLTNDDIENKVPMYLYEYKNRYNRRTQTHDFLLTFLPDDVVDSAIKWFDIMDSYAEQVDIYEKIIDAIEIIKLGKGIRFMKDLFVAFIETFYISTAYNDLLNIDDKDLTKYDIEERRDTTTECLWLLEVMMKETYGTMLYRYVEAVELKFRNGSQGGLFPFLTSGDIQQFGKEVLSSHEEENTLMQAIKWLVKTDHNIESCLAISKELDIFEGC